MSTQRTQLLDSLAADLLTATETLKPIAPLRVAERYDATAQLILEEIGKDGHFGGQEKVILYLTAQLAKGR